MASGSPCGLPHGVMVYPLTVPVHPTLPLWEAIVRLIGAPKRPAFWDDGLSPDY